MEEKLLDIVEDILRVSRELLTIDTKKEDLEMWDSLVHIQLVAEVEFQFNCEIGFDEVEKISCVRDFLQFIEVE